MTDLRKKVSLRVLATLRKHRRLSQAQIVQLTGCSRTSVRVNIAKLLDAGAIRRSGYAGTTPGGRMKTEMFAVGNERIKTGPTKKYKRRLDAPAPADDTKLNQIMAITMRLQVDGKFNPFAAMVAQMEVAK